VGWVALHQVPAFDNATAMATIEKELGAPPSEIYSELTTDPIAAASLGQVYKGVVRTTGELVAVKVQRPYVLDGHRGPVRDSQTGHGAA
jgi:aarF domain-containing kinase